MAEKHKLKSLKRKIRRNAKAMVSKKVRLNELQERCGLTNANNRSETDLESDSDEIDEDRNNYSESDTYWGDRESDENAENIIATILQGSPTHIIDDNNAISDEENTGDNRSNSSAADTSSEQDDDRDEIEINMQLKFICRQWCESYITVVTSKPSAVQLVKGELLQEVSSKVDILLINQERILRKLFPGEQAVVRPKNLPQLPLQTHEAFNAFQKFLQNDINFNATVDYFASFSRADTEKSAVGKLLPKIISNTLARILNWAGSGRIKLGIEGTTLHEALQCAILKNFPKSDLQAAEGSMKRWFHTSNQRKVD